MFLFCRLAATNRTIIIAVNKIDLLTAKELTRQSSTSTTNPTTNPTAAAAAPILSGNTSSSSTSLPHDDIYGDGNDAAAANREYSDFYEAAIWNSQPNPTPNLNVNNISSGSNSAKEGRKERGKLAVTELTALWKHRLPAAGSYMSICMYVCMYVCMRGIVVTFVVFFLNTSTLMGSTEELSDMYVYTYVHTNSHNF